MGPSHPRNALSKDRKSLKSLRTHSPNAGKQRKIAKTAKASLLEGSTILPEQPKVSNPFPTPSDLTRGLNPQYEPFEVVPAMIPEGGKHLEFVTARDMHLPQIYELKSHILVPSDIRDSVRRILLILWPGGDRAYARFFFHHVKDNLGVPRGPNSRMDALGKLSIPISTWY